MKMIGQVRMYGAILGFGLALSLASAAKADEQPNGGDSSSDVSGGFSHVVQQANGVMIRVPVTADGKELTDAAELRVYTGPEVSTAADLRQVFDAAVDASNQPEVTQENLDHDSSTSWCGWGSWRNNGWYNNYYYGYRPTYYYGGCRYNFYSPYYQSYPSYNRWGCYGYRYYYYPRGY